MEGHKQGPPTAPTCRRSCRRGRAPGQSSAPTATAGGRGWAGRSPSWRGMRAQVPAAPQPCAGVRLSRPSVPSLPWCGLFLPPALGFFLRKRGRRRPDPDVRGVAGRGEAGNAAAWAIFGPCCHPGSRNGWSEAQHGHAGVGTHLNISAAVIPLSLCHPPSPPKLF